MPPPLALFSHGRGGSDSGPVVLPAKRRARVLAASPDDGVTGVEEPIRRRRLVKRRDLEAAPTRHPPPPAARPARPPARRGATAARFFDEEAALSGEEGSGDEGPSDGEGTADDSFVTRDLSQPEGGTAEGLGLYRRLMHTPASGAAAGNPRLRFHGPPVAGPAYRLADLRAGRAVRDTPSGAGSPSEAEEVAEGVSDEDEVEEAEADANEDFCRLCRDGGDLLCCDACPAAYHPTCLGLAEPPPGDWFCAACAAAMAVGEDLEPVVLGGDDFGAFGGTFASGGPGGTGLPVSAPPPAPSGEAMGSADVFSSDEEPCFDLGV